ncbi:unnamed protein product [Sphagnum jensenii]|uniref:Protein kinase domain-containing protein n=1 Tax=Sphagnum jensenii TaxID=128206 RepID=A0ABP1BC10_9BRYO
MGSSYGLKGKGVDLSQGPPKRKTDVVQIPVVIETPLVPAENAPSSSGWHRKVIYQVHDLNPTCNSDNPNLTIIFFHGITFGTNDAWKETWTTLPINNREESICWPEKWLPNDLNDNVRILSLSYDSNIVAGVHNDVTEIGENLIQSLVTNSRYQSLWDGPVALVAYSFGGLVFKSLVVEAHKHVHQKQRNDLDAHVHKCCKTFLNNVKGVIFYGVPHASGTLDLSNYFIWQHQQINTLRTQFGFLKNLKSFNRQMECLSIDFDNAIREDVNIYAFGEGLPLNKNWGFLFRQPNFSFEVPQELPNIIKGVPSQDLELATNSTMDLEILFSPFQDLELVANFLMHLQILISTHNENRVTINELQCQYLLEKFCDTLIGAKACIQDASLQDVQESHDILKSLAQLAKEAEKLVRDCCDRELIQAAMIFANAKEHFASLILKLRLHMELLQSILKEGATKEFLAKLQERIDDIKDKEFHFIDEKAMEDRQRLLSRLTKVGSSDSKNLIKRLEISSNRAILLHENATNVIEAWKVEHKNIHRVPNGQIGRGGSATVRKVTWLGNDFAEKTFYGHDNNEAMRKEAFLLAGLSHPNILPLICCATRARSCSLVMELMDKDLFQLMEELVNNESQDPPFKLLEAVDIMLQVAEGMNYLHQNKVVHRDLKSKNILVKHNERDMHVYAKVADFGLSKIKELSCTYSNLTMESGTTRWMAPELFGDSEDHNVGPSSSTESNLTLNYHFKVDVYSFGMVCYEILTGCVPFFNIIKMTDLRKRIKDGLRPDMPEQCPKQLSNLIQSCYHPDPKARPLFPDICVELRHIMFSLMVNFTL